MNIISKTFFFIRCKSHLTTVAFRFCVIFPLYSFFSHQYTGILRESELFSIVDILERCIVSAFSILSNCLKQYSFPWPLFANECDLRCSKVWFLIFYRCNAHGINDGRPYFSQQVMFRNTSAIIYY